MLLPWLARLLARGRRGVHLCEWLTEPRWATDARLPMRRHSNYGRTNERIASGHGFEGALAAIDFRTLLRAAMLLPNVLKDKLLLLPVVGAPPFIISIRRW
jgi:hypothetical protein